jgi:hypothetical protein
MYLILRIGPFVAAEWNFGYDCSRLRLYSFLNDNGFFLSLIS